MPTTPVSPYHKIELAEPLLQMLKTPPEKDYVVRRIAEKSVNGQPLIQGELIISGVETLEQYSSAVAFPVHFRKTYYPICFHQNPEREYAHHLAASKAIDVPPPIGHTRTTFRSCFLPGKPLSVWSPFQVEPMEANIAIAQDAEPLLLIGLWTLLEKIYDQVTTLHQHGLAHGDLFLHNIIVSTEPLGAFLIDFELTIRRDEKESLQWEEACQADHQEILKQALYAQCGLGQQHGLLAEHAIRMLSDLPEQTKHSFERALKPGSISSTLVH